MTGVTLPDSMSSLSATRSVAFSELASAAELLADEQGQHGRPELAVDAAEPPSAGLAADDDERPARGEGAAEVRQRAVPADVEDDVVAALPSVKSSRV